MGIILILWSLRGSLDQHDLSTFGNLSTFGKQGHGSFSLLSGIQQANKG